MAHPSRKDKESPMLSIFELELPVCFVVVNHVRFSERYRCLVEKVVPARGMVCNRCGKGPHFVLTTIMVMAVLAVTELQCGLISKMNRESLDGK